MGSLQPTGRSFGLCDLLPAVDNGARSLLLNVGSGRLAASTISGGFRQIRERLRPPPQVEPRPENQYTLFENPEHPESPRDPTTPRF